MSTFIQSVTFLVLLLAAACGLLLFRVFTVVPRIKRLIEEDREPEALVKDLYDRVRQDGSDGEDADMEALSVQLREAYNRQAERHEQIDHLRRSMIASAGCTALIGALTALVILFGA